MEVKIFHFSDFHFEHNTKISDSRISSIRSMIDDCIIDNIHCILIFSGDIANSGKEIEYKQFKSFFIKLVDGLDTSLYSVVMVPGNHDQNIDLYSKEAEEKREEIVNNTLKERKSPNLEFYENANLQDSFFELFSMLCEAQAIYDKLMYRYTVKIDNTFIEIDMLNTASCSLRTDMPGNSLFPTELIDRNISDPQNKLKICVFHHPFQWINRDINSDFQVSIDRLYDMVIFGHEHKEAIEEKHDVFEDERSIYFTGSIFYSNKNKHISKFSTILIDLDKNDVNYGLYEWNNKIYDKNPEKAKSFKLPKVLKSIKGKISEDFTNFINETEFDVEHKEAGRLSLLETFVHNDMIEDYKESKPQIIHSVDLVTDKRIVFSSKRGYGKTTLIKYYFVKMFEKKYLPVYIDINNIKKVYRNSDFANVVKQIFKRTYNVENDYFNIPKEYRVLFLDNIENLKVVSNFKQSFFDYLDNQFEIIVVTEGVETELTHRFRVENDNTFKSWKNYTLIEIKKYSLETILQKWYNRFDCKEPEKIRSVENTKNLLKTVNKEGQVPFIHKYVYVAIQMIDGNFFSKDNSKQSLPYYYEFLLNRKLEKMNFEAEDRLTAREFLYLLAYKMYNLNAEIIGIEDFYSIYKDYKSSRGINEVSAPNIYNSEDFLNYFIESGILYKKSNQLRFKERYLYYYTLTKYLSDNYYDPQLGKSIRKGIQNSINHFNKERNSNLINFYIYQERSVETIIIKILTKAKSLLKYSRRYYYDTNSSLCCISSENYVPTYMKSEVSTRIRRLNQAKEEDDRLSDYGLVLTESEESVNEISNKLIEAFQMIELLCNILKVHWWKLDDSKFKLPIMKEIFVLTEKCIYQLHKTLFKVKSKLIEGSKPILVEALLSKEPKKDEHTISSIKNFVDIELEKFYDFLQISLNSGCLITTFMNISFLKLDSTIKLYLKNNNRNTDIYKIFFDILTYDNFDKNEITDFIKKHKDENMTRRVLEVMFLIYFYQFDASNESQEAYSSLIKEGVIGDPRKLLK